MTFSFTKLSDPRIVEENRLAPRSDHQWYRTPAELASGNSSFVTSLNGRWKFAYAKNPASAVSGFEALGFPNEQWDDITVPGHIQLQGYDAPQYVNTQYPWDGNQDVPLGGMPTEFNPVASYVTWFDAPDLADGEKLLIRFDGAEATVALWLNGQYIGYATDAFTASTFDLTAALRPGENKLAVQVVKWWAGSWLEDQDFYRFSGLFRSVTLLVQPVVHIRDLRVKTDLIDDFTAATVSLEVELEGAGTVSATLEGVGPLVEEGSGHFAITVQNPTLWSADSPYLYDLDITVTDEAGNPVEYLRQEVGIRRFAIEDGVMKINGKRIVFKGVNRHEFGLNGRVVTAEETEQDLIQLKQYGLNSIRTSHYPNSTHLYELADRYGFYVIDEMNLESHGAWDRIHFQNADVAESIPGDDPKWLPTLLDRAANMLQRDKNHPSIVMWSCGNESFGGTDILEVSTYFRSQDSRPVHYEGVSWDQRYPETTDVVSQMYTPAADVEDFLKDNRDKPMILCEFAHAMGNSFGAVDRYMDLTEREPLFQGGFIWDFSDQAIALKDRFGNEYFGYGGDCNEAPHDADFCGNGIFFADHSPTPRLQEVKYVYRDIKVAITESQFTVSNQSLFTATGAYDCVVTLAKEDLIVDQVAMNVDVPAGEDATFPLPFTLPSEPGEYAVEVAFLLAEDTLWAERGFEVAFEQEVFTVEGTVESSVLPAPQLIVGIHNFGVKGRHFHAMFSRLHGGLTSYKWAGRELLQAPPRPNFWHAPTSNERGWKSSAEDGQWLLASRYATHEFAVDNPSAIVEGNVVVVTYQYRLPTTPASNCEVTYRVDGAGRVEVTLSVQQGIGLPDMPEFGMLFVADADLDTFTWYGDGPEESYVDRRGGTRVGVFEAPVADQLTPYLLPQEAGNHTGVRWAEVTDDKGWGIRFEAIGEMEFSALPWSPFEIENATHHHELPPIHHTFMRPALMRRGVAGDDTWGSRPHAEYLLPTGPLEFTFAFGGIN